MYQIRLVVSDRDKSRVYMNLAYAYESESNPTPDYAAAIEWYTKLIAFGLMSCVERLQLIESDVLREMLAGEAKALNH